MLSVSEFLYSFKKNQLVIRISVQIDDFFELDYPSGSHKKFDDDSVQLTNCKLSPQNYLFIIEEITKTEQKIKLFFGEKNILIYSKTQHRLLKQSQNLKY